MKPKLMGVLNITPDSYFEGSRTQTIDQAVSRAIQFQVDGSDILDVGGESSRPGSDPVSEEEELKRVIPVIQELTKNISIPISIDTTKPIVAKAAIEAGAVLLNDITGFSNPEMLRIAKDFDLDICVMHMLGNPKTMQLDPKYSNGVVAALNEWFTKKTEILTNQGIKPERIILDPGIGFGKTVADNLAIIHNLPLFKQLGFRLLIGASRKSFLSKILNMKTEELLPATLAANAMALFNGADIIRVHDVKEHRSVIDFIEAYKIKKE